jgi:hypothetical protein
MAQTYVPISTQTLATTSSLITFSSIPQTYTDLRLVISSTSSSSYLNTNLFFNTDTGGSGTSYAYNWLASNNASGAGSANYGTNNNQSYITIGQINVSSSTTTPTLCIVDIFSYRNTALYKSVLSQHSSIRTNTNGEVAVFAGNWRSTAAINTVKIAPGASTFAAGSTFTLWGI